MQANVIQDRIRITPDGRVSRAHAAKFLGLQPKTLAEWKRLRRGPEPHLVGGRIFYWYEDLVDFVNATADEMAGLIGFWPSRRHQG